MEFILLCNVEHTFEVAVCYWVHNIDRLRVSLCYFEVDLLNFYVPLLEYLYILEESGLIGISLTQFIPKFHCPR